jgi:hypothetical protein
VTSPTITGDYHLYRFKGRGVLLYIGKSNDAGRRMFEHLRLQPWWAEVDEWQIDLTPYVTEAAVLAAEKAAIVKERPRYNIQHNGGNPHRVDPRTMRRPSRTPQVERLPLFTAGGRRGARRWTARQRRLALRLATWPAVALMLTLYFWVGVHIGIHDAAISGVIVTLAAKLGVRAMRSRRRRW